MLVSACVQHSRDEMPDIHSLWTSDAYLKNQSGSSRPLLLKQARIFLDNGDYQQAWNRLNRETFRFVSNPELSFLKGKTAYYLQSHYDAQRYLQDARELGYTADELFYLIAANDLALGDAESAIGVVNTLLRLEQKPSFHTLKGDVLLQTGDTTGAQKEYRTSIRSDSSIRNNYLGLATISAHKEDYDAALELADKWLTGHPADREFLFLKAHLLEQSGRNSEAGRIYAAIPGDNDPWLLAIRAQNYLDQGKADSAALLANQSIVYNDSLATRMILARALERQRLYGDAEKTYRSVLERDSTQADAAAAVKRLEQRRQYLQYLREQRAEQAVDSLTGNSE